LFFLQETAPVPELKKFEQDKHCMSMGLLWALSAVIPPSYTHSDQKEGEGTGTKNLLLTSFNLLMKLVCNMSWFYNIFADTVKVLFF